MDEITFRQIVENVRERIDIVDLISESVKLEPSGSVLKGRSPFNPDQHPSLIVWPRTQSWCDYSGGGSIGGDCFDFVQKRDGVTFMDALRLLASRVGVDVPGTQTQAVVEELRHISERRRIQDLLTAAAAYYHTVLPSKIRRAWFVEKYGFTDETIDIFLLGWSNGHLFDHLTDLFGATREEALATGLFIKLKDGRVEDFFHDRLIFPYWKHGRVVYFIARATEHSGDEPWEKAKYKKLLTHSDRHPYVSRFVTNDTFYNEDAAKNAKELLITEGVTDCISAMQCDVACISPVTVRFRKRDHDKLLTLTERCEKIVICNDTEDSGAGESGAIETAQALYAAGRDVRIAVIEKSDDKEKIDLNELVCAEGPDALKRLLKTARRLPEHLIERISEDTPPSCIKKGLESIKKLSEPPKIGYT
ncbi:MAG: hypothetical protein JXA30_08980 [Deltaproteobacteria bacterium]|nr:hypothetical protein [Deltaproteobacteria bacterium]